MILENIGLSVADKKTLRSDYGKCMLRNAPTICGPLMRLRRMVRDLEWSRAVFVFRRALATEMKRGDGRPPVTLVVTPGKWKT